MYSTNNLAKRRILHRDKTKRKTNSLNRVQNDKNCKIY